MKTLKLWWKDHGTKILGYGTAALATIEFVDHVTLQLIERTLGPKLGPPVSLFIQIVGGLLTARRGYANSNRAPP